MVISDLRCPTSEKWDIEIEAEKMGGEVIIVVMILLVIGVVAYLGHQAAKRRQEEMFLLAAQLGLQFEPHPEDLHDRYDGFTPFGRGDSRKCHNHLFGRAGEIDWDIFDYQFTTGTGKDRHTEHWGIVVAQISLVLPRMTIRPEGFFDKFAALVGFDDINFESEQFSSRYHVKCDDRKACFDLIHPQMMEYLLAGEARDWQIRGTRIILTRRGKQSIEQIDQDIKLIEGFMTRVPQYMRQERGIGAPPI